MEKITPEMREELRAPLPEGAVTSSQKSYLSSIKSIYVTERINDVFGLGSWTLKSTPIDAGDKMVVVQTVLEIPEYGFYGESYGGNDNIDRGDAYKGATTDALTKIAAQQLEIGIDVYKGLGATTTKAAKETKTQAKATPAQLDQLKELKAKGANPSEIILRFGWKVSKMSDLTNEQAARLITEIKG